MQSGKGDGGVSVAKCERIYQFLWRRRVRLSTQTYNSDVRGLVGAVHSRLPICVSGDGWVFLDALFATEWDVWKWR